MHIEDLVSVSVLPLVLAPWVLYFLTFDALYAKWTVAVVLSQCIVGAIQFVLGENTINQRPALATKCGVLNDDHFPVWGMPSGHVTHAALGSMTIALLLCQHTGAAILLAMAYISSVSWARYKKNCHSVPQVVAGCVLGVTVALSMSFGAPRIEK